MSSRKDSLIGRVGATLFAGMRFGSLWPVLGALTVLAVSGWAFTHRLGSFPLLDDPNEAQYAEVAREMTESGDWLSPQLNYVLFLNKPPFSYWAIATVYEFWGIHEAAARLPGAIAGWLTVLAIVVWGWKALGPLGGCLAGGILASMGGFFVETHEVRPDLWLVLGLTLSMFALWLLFQNPEQRLERWSPPLALWQVGLSLGLLSKGMLGLVFPGFSLLVLLASRRQLSELRFFFHPRAWWLLLALVGPWHVAMSLIHEGFLWDYVINQHLLFFFDKKFPRDSNPISLPMFWAAFAMRVFPWTVFAPLAFVGGVVRWREAQSREARGVFALTVSWLVAVLALFSAATSRLEHYSLPALPPLAMLIAAHLSSSDRFSVGRWQQITWAHWVFLAFVFANGLWVVPRLIHEQEWLSPNTAFVDLAVRVFGGFSLAGVLALLLWWRGAGKWAPVPIMATFAAIVPLFCEGLVLMAPNNSSFSLALQIERYVREQRATVVYQAPEEYQTCAGLNYYLRKRVEILPPGGYVLPTYLQPHAERLFIDDATLRRWWHERPVVWVSDPLSPPEDLDRALPGPYEIIARDATRVAVRNVRPTPAASPSDAVLPNTGASPSG